MTRTEALAVLNSHLKNPNLIKHCFAAEAAMRGLCKYINKDATPEQVDLWGITGLLHDADYEECADHPEQHGVLITQQVKLPDEMAYAISAHNFENTKVIPYSPMDWSIACCDQLTGLIVAATLISPTKKLADITTDFVMKRFYEKSFAKGADRKTIQMCEEKLNIPLVKFIEVVLSSMKEIAPSLGL